MKSFPQRQIQLIDKELNDNLGDNNFIFIGSSCDMFADDVPSVWIQKVINHCAKYPGNVYLLQTKNPKRFNDVGYPANLNIIFGTTIESNRNYGLSKAPPVDERRFYIEEFHPSMVTLEPLLDFDLDILVDWMKRINPKWINIGADSKGHHLPEPPAEKIKALIIELKKFADVKLKSNLVRLGNFFDVKYKW